jgi:hypothetical protein
MKSLDIPIVITPTLTLPPQRGRGNPGFPDGNELVKLLKDLNLGVFLFALLSLL